LGLYPSPPRLHVTHMDESCHSYEWVTSHTIAATTGRYPVDHVAYMNESHHTYEWVISHIWVNHMTYMEWCRTYRWVMHSYERVTSHIIAATTGRYPVDSKALRAYLRYGNKKVSFIGLFHRSLFTYVKRCWSFRSFFAMQALRAYLRYGIALVSFIGLFYTSPFAEWVLFWFILIRKLCVRTSGMVINRSPF